MYISVPNKLLCNKSIKPDTVYLYVWLKMLYDYTTNTVNIYAKKLLNKLEWLDNRTLKKHLEKLKQTGYISYEFDTLPIRDILQIYIRPLDAKGNKEDYYTEIDKEIILKLITIGKTTKIAKEIKDLKEQTIKLYYIYEKYYNSDYEYAWISYDEINEFTGFSNTYIKSINNNLRKNKLLEIELGKWYENEDGISTRERNKYVPMIGRRNTKKTK